MLMIDEYVYDAVDVDDAVFVDVDDDDNVEVNDDVDV